MEMLRCSLVITLWNTLLFFFLALIIIPPFPLSGHVIVYSVIGYCVIINSPNVILTVEKRLKFKVAFNFIYIIILSTILFLLQKPTENCIIGHNSCYFSKLSSRVDVNFTFCLYQLNMTLNKYFSFNMTSTGNNCSHNNVFSEDIELYYIPAAFTFVGLSTLTIAFEYAYYRFYEMTYKDFILWDHVN